MKKAISEKICEFRKERSLTQEQLGAKLGVSSQAVSKWEKGECMPDIMLLPQLCEVFGVTADALLEVPSSVKKDSCMNQLSSYAREVGESKATFEAIQACSNIPNDCVGSVRIAKDEIRIIDNLGYALAISGEKALNQIQNMDFETIAKICELLGDENTIKVIRVLEYDTLHDEKEISKLSGLPLVDVQSALFKLMKFSFCDCNINGGYTFGLQSYVLFSILSGMYIISNRHSGLYNIARQWRSFDNKL